MDKDFWIERWQQQQIGFHQPDINQYLLKYWQTTKEHFPDSQVFVPLCGKSSDLLWLKQQGHKVLGIEFSELAVNDFFRENQLAPSLLPDKRFLHLAIEDLSLMCGDFFQLCATDLEKSHLVYDRASLVALPQDMRKDYAKHMAKILPTSVRMLLITMEYPQNEMNGPPFSVPETEVIALYQDNFHIKKLETFDIYHENPRFQARGLSSLLEKVFLLSR